MTRTDIRDHFQKNRSAAEIGRALGVLQEHGLARVERKRESEDGFNLTERWFAITVSEAK
jgi:transcription initiation factor IIE alpha subunit